MALRCRWMGVDAVFMDETLPLSALIVRTFYGQKVAMTVADFFMTIYFRRLRWLRPLCRMVEALDLAAWRRLPLIFTHVRHARSYLAERGVPADRIHPVYNPCDRRTYFPRDRVEARRRFGIPADALVLVHHGILHPNKGNDRIIRAVADLRRRVPNLLYLLVGSGPERERLVALAGSLGVPDGVLFTGWLPAEEDVNWALNAADIGLVMRIGQFSDSFHITDTLVHEMACRLPILAARLAGIEEVIRDGENGFLFDPDDLEEFKAKLLALAADPALRERLGRAALEVCAREFDLDRAADQMAGPLLRLVAAD
jgi:glycosyltransferase involved in cell wall biosynthesis